MPFSISSFKSTGLKYGGARPTLFDVNFASPAAVNLPTTLLAQLPVMCMASQLPSSDMGEIDVPYFGRKIYVAGNRIFRPWTCTIMNDEDFGIKTMFEAWSNALNQMEANLCPDVTDNDYKTDVTIQQYGKDGSIIRAYTLVGAWPTIIDAIPVNWSAVNQFEQYNVTFRYDYWVPNESAANSTISSVVSYASDGADIT